jgi:Glycosyltransferase 61
VKLFTYLRRSKPLLAAYYVVGLPFLKRQPLPSTILGPVKGAHPSLADWIERHQAAGCFHHSLRRFGKGEVIHTQSPVLALPKVPNHFLRNNTHETPAPYLGRIRDARIATRYIEVIAPDDRVFEDQFPKEPGAPSGAKSLFLPRLPRLERKSGRYAVICTGRASNYYHWLNDCLPRLRWLEESSASGFLLLVPEILLPFHIQSLDALGYTPDRRVAFGHQHWELEGLLIPSLASEPGQSSPTACRWLRGRLLKALPQVNPPLPRRIYISRALATKRRLLNEPELIEVLRSLGFVSITTENLSVAEQARLFENADVVVAPHGAGLTNILFMRPGTLVLELIPILKPKTCYYSLASAMGVRYACVTDAPDPFTPEPSGRQPDRDFTIPVDRVKLALEQVGVGSPPASPSPAAAPA